MSNIVSVTDFRNNIADVLNRVKYRNETIYLVRGKTLVAKVSKVDDYLPITAKNRKGPTEAGFLPAVFALAKRELGEIREVGEIWGRKVIKNLIMGLKV